MPEASLTLKTRVADFRARMRVAGVTQTDVVTFQKVAAIMDKGRGGIDLDDLIAASFVTDMVDK
ncbi:hypothetical protein [Mesorhizobium loti]|uniref:hypothetical protein n=1 Tax=Rhizobium loti TaxID=381 RepID=UPI00047AC068|nr:hypothetical protein [Mesorhizobium loti]